MPSRALGTSGRGQAMGQSKVDEAVAEAAAARAEAAAAAEETASACAEVEALRAELATVRPRARPPRARRGALAGRGCR
jgi:hypothetical protein